MNKNTIFLIGMRGSGKTVVGIELSKILNWNFIDTDFEIEKLTKTTIKDIFTQKGESFFRKIENNVLNNIKNIDKTIISTGGGIVIDENNRNILKNQISVFLDAHPKILFERIKRSNRPALTQFNTYDEILYIYNQRLKYYEESSVIRIDTTDLSIKEVASAIKYFWEQLQNNDVR